MRKTIFSLLLCFSAGLAVSQSSDISNINNQLLSSSVVALSQFEIPADALFFDADEKTLFIDLERIKYNVKEVSLASNEGELVYQQDVATLPVDAILEIDYSRFHKGKYLLEVKTYVQRLHKSISF